MKGPGGFLPDVVTTTLKRRRFFMERCTCKKTYRILCHVCSMKDALQQNFRREFWKEYFRDEMSGTRRKVSKCK
mgnify:CR=1 FL=1